ncbi:hypothetical protein PC129_g3740 [Phytophthora cactorum]|uniref:Tudor domain-containing protein n=1 Tax=Phytophthora cactorum TaxID=29920 RepID=A0A8T1CYI1_9STRA|nr:hypothetical protein Pcac1_g19864 [Phytophthora cactorum]KAG2916360.1 hypothetical protein PC114_g7528 [Phytophthora cactorum]KAG2930711.1 hypothetical protein PC115_g6359 [Phytophthora cactorum]KAG3092044.1 hypothetical protein PC122_g6713 [Phytophthora cactorum]KAG3225634.1 hypothetical protein PC129_g3740 [Phytophthora cactorum]
MQGDQAVGCRVQVYWEGEGEWFNGVVDAYSAERGYYVKYDDGEEQWELDAGEYSIRFLTEPGSGRSDGVSAGIASTREEEERLDSTGASPKDDSEAGSVEEYEDAYEDGEQEEPLEQDSDEEAANPIAKKEDLASITATTKPQKAVKPARAFMRTSAAFFRDEDTLREMRQDLRQEKRTLTNQVHILTMQLAEKEQVAAALKSELQGLKTSAMLANVMRQVPRFTTLSGSSSGTVKGLSKPKTAAEWGERVLDQKLENQILAEELLALKTAVQDKQLSVQRKQKQRDEMSAKLSRVPRRHLCTLVDLQLEISRLLEEKRALEIQPRPSSSRAKPEKMSSLNVSASTKAVLQNELTSLEVTTERYKEELRQWHLKIDCEKARLAPLETRLASLQLELQRYEDSQVLLRSVFLRLGPDKRDGCVPLEAALSAFQTLTPLDRDALAAEEMVVRLKESSILSLNEGDQQRLSFTQFVTAFSYLFKS